MMDPLRLALAYFVGYAASGWIGYQLGKSRSDGHKLREELKKEVGCYDAKLIRQMLDEAHDQRHWPKIVPGPETDAERAERLTRERSSFVPGTINPDTEVDLQTGQAFSHKADAVAAKTAKELAASLELPKKRRGGKR